MTPNHFFPKNASSIKGSYMALGIATEAGLVPGGLTLLGDTYLQKRFVKLGFKWNFCILGEKCGDF
jgi:hypothetical protein